MSEHDLQQTLLSSPLVASNESSQPDMTDVFELPGFSWNGTSPGTGDWMDVDAGMDGSTQIFDNEHNPEAFPASNPGPAARAGDSEDVGHPQRFAPLSIFGNPLGDPLNGSAGFEIAPLSIFGNPSEDAPDGNSDSILANDLSAFNDADLISGTSAYGGNLSEYDQSGIAHVPADPDQLHLPHNSAEDAVEGYVYEQNIDHDLDFTMAGAEECAADDIDQHSETFEDSELGAKKWDLRPSASILKRGFTSTWRDQDDSGNYDPEEERNLKAAKRARKKTLGLRKSEIAGLKAIEDANTESEDTSGEATSDQQSESNPAPVVLSFTTDGCIDAFKKMLSRLAVQQTTRRRGRRLKKQSDLENLGSADLLTDCKNKPIARCCRSCAGMFGEDAAALVNGKADCSLATHPTQWPCMTCFEVDVPCILITEPIRKLACEDCKRMRVPCSYISTRNHAGPCRQCKTADHQCVAGPAKDAVVPRLEYKLVLQGGFPVLNDDGEQTYTCDAVTKKNSGKKRRPAACVECSKMGLHCDYGSDPGACRECKRTDQACTIPEKNSIVSKGVTQSGPSEPDAPPPVEAGLPEEMPLCEIQDREGGPMGTLRKMLTSFSHPITFNCDDEEPSRTCHLCDHPALQFVGFGKAMASVIDFEDSSGFVEVSGGHRANLIEPTALCTECTTSRLSIIMCGGHQMTPISDTKYTVRDEERALNSLLDGNLEEISMGDFCSICPSLATLRCTGDQEDGPKGCGLRLCDRCTATLVGRYDGSLGGMLAHEEGTAAEGEGDGEGFRADAELLRSDGVLVRYLTCLSRG